MAVTIGRVVETPKAGWAEVVAENGPGCGSCGSVSHCHGGRSANVRQTTVRNQAGAQVGDRVMLSVNSGTLLSRLALLYLLPVAMLLFGAFWGAALDGGPGATTGGQSVGYGLAGFGLGFGLSVVISRIWSKSRPVTPFISRVITNRFQPKGTHTASGCGCAGR